MIVTMTYDLLQAIKKYGQISTWETLTVIS